MELFERLKKKIGRERGPIYSIQYSSQAIPPSFQELEARYLREKERLLSGKEPESMDIISHIYLGYALDCMRASMKQRFRPTLTLKEKDIEAVDKYLEAAHRDLENRKLRKEALMLTARRYAGYVGYLIIYHKGGHWAEEVEGMESRGAAVCQDNGNSCFLTEKIQHRIETGWAESLLPYYDSIQSTLPK